MPAMQKLLSSLSFAFVLLIPGVLVAQDTMEHPSLIGTWEGELVRGRDNMTLAFTFGFDNGSYTAAITSSALGIFGMPAENVSVKGHNVNITINRLDLQFYGTLRFAADGSVERIDGDYYQQSEMVPVVLNAVSDASF